MRVALYEPEIPPNTGNIGRLCVGFGSQLILIGRLGFSLDEKSRRRAGLDYWEHLTYRLYDDFTAFWEAEHLRAASTHVLCLSKQGSTDLYDWKFSEHDILLLGGEAHGVPLEITERFAIPRVSIPMTAKLRSYNLANAAAMTLAEAYRQVRWELG